MEFLLDSCPNEDSLGGYHKKIADGLGKLLNETQQPLTIAICGERGSGKSTILEFIKKDCKDKNFAVLEYDAWLHEHDAPRRSFVVSLYKNSREHLNTSEVFNYQYDRLKQHKKFRSCLNRFGTKEYFFLVFYALIVLFLTKQIGEYLSIAVTGLVNLYFEPHIQASTSDLVIALFKSAILLIALGLPLFLSISKERREKYLKPVSSLLKVEVAGDIDQSKQDMEYHDFIGYCECLFSQLNQRDLKPIILIDNLDRIQSDEETLERLSQIKSILDPKNYKKPNSKHSPVIFVPIRPELIRRKVKDANKDKEIMQNYKLDDSPIDSEKFFDIVVTSINLDVLEVSINDFINSLIQEHIFTIPVFNGIDKSDAYFAFKGYMSPYSRTIRGCKKYINDLKLEIHLVGDLFQQILDEYKTLNKEKLWQVFAMYIAIRNYHDASELDRISSWEENFSNVYQKIYSNGTGRHFGELQDVYNCLEARELYTYPVTKRNVAPQLNRALYQILSRDPDVKLDEYTVHFYQRVRRQDHLIQIILEKLKAREIISSLDADLLQFYKLYDYFESIIGQAEKSSYLNDKMRANIEQIFSYINESIIPEISNFLICAFTEYSKVYDVIHDRLKIKIDLTSLTTDEETTRHFFKPKSIYDVFIFGIIAKLSYTYMINESSMLSNEAEFLIQLMSLFRSDSDFYQLFSSASVNFIKKDSHNLLENYVSKMIPAEQQSNNPPDLKNRYLSELIKIADWEAKYSRANGIQNNYFFKKIIDAINST